MELCKGFENWLECSRCPYLCTKKCPLESENVMEEMKRHKKLFIDINHKQEIQDSEKVSS